MLRPVNTQGLTGLELVKHAGWPYHGKTTAEYYSGTLSRRELVGHAWAAGAALDGTRNHYPVRANNQAPPWDYHFLYGADLQYGSNGYGQIPSAISATGGHPLPLGIPLKTQSGLLRLGVLKGSAHNSIKLLDMTHSYIRDVSISFSVTGDSRYVVIQPSNGRVALLTLSEIAALNSPNIPLYKTTVLDFFENRALIAVELSGYCDSLASVPDDLDHRYYMSGAESGQNHGYEKGRTLITVIEAVAAGNDIDDVTVSVVYSHQTIEGAVARSSPSTVTQDGSVTRYNWSLTANSVILDAWYSAAGSIQLLRGDFTHTRQAQSIRMGSVNADSYFKVDHESYCRIYSPQGSVSEKLKHTWVYDLDSAYVEGCDSSTGICTITDNVSCRIWRNDQLVSEQYGYDANLRLWSVKDQHQRAPWSGDEMKYLTCGYSMIYTDQVNSFRPEIYTLTYRNNGTSSSALYCVLENFIRGEEIPMLKRIFAAGVISKSGIKNIAPFSDSVTWDDPRYVRPEGANVFHMRGYVGAITRAIVNPMTGELSGGTVQRPIAHTGFR